MLLIHPAIQTIAILIALYAFWMGSKRALAVHFHKKAVFPWKRHIWTGRIAFSLLLIGFFVGMAMVRIHWGNNLMTLGHGKMALVTLPFIVAGFIMGEMLARKSPHRDKLRVVHGLNNLLVLILLFNQARLGIEVYRLFVAGL